MKKIVYPLLGIAGLFGLASCAQEDVNAPANDGVNIKVRLPRDMQTRGSFGDGTDAGDRAVLNNLQWSVYEVVDGVASATPVFSDLKAGAFGGSQTEETVTLPLAKGKTYQVAFYADDSTNGFVTYTDGKINVDYSKAASNTAAEDAFIGRSVQFTVDGAYSETVTLTRPFAQLNWGTDDLDAKVLGDLLKSLTASVKVSSGLYTAMDVLSGEVDATTAVSDAVEFGTVAFSALPAQTFPVEGYSLIAMDYLLTGDGTIDCELDFDNGLNPVSVNAAPVKVNYRTNIYGSLLTAPADFNIKVDNNFETPDNNIENKDIPKWDGTQEEVTPEDGVYTANTPAQLAYLVNNLKGADALTAKTINITSDMDFSGQDWTSNTITANLDTGATFTFDFNGHTISGLNKAFFDRFVGNIKNVTFVNCNIEGTTNENGFSGVVCNNLYGTLENVKVENSTITCTGIGRSVGAIAGQYTSGNATDCAVSEITINKATDYKAGGMFGSVNQESNPRVFTNLSASNVTINDDNGSYVGALIGRVYGCNLTLTGCSVTNSNPSALYGATAGGGTVTEN